MIIASIDSASCSFRWAIIGKSISTVKFFFNFLGKVSVEAIE